MSSPNGRTPLLPWPIGQGRGWVQFWLSGQILVSLRVISGYLISATDANAATAQAPDKTVPFGLASSSGPLPRALRPCIG